MVDYDKIVELRLLGYSHRLIGKTLGCARETSVRVCSKAGLAKLIKVLHCLQGEQIVARKRPIRDLTEKDGHRPWLAFCGENTQKAEGAKE